MNMFPSASENNALFWAEERLPEFQANAAIKAFLSEASKGCTGEISPSELDSIVPSFSPFVYINNRYEVQETDVAIEMSFPKSYSLINLYFNEQDCKYWHKPACEILAHMHAINQMFMYEVIAFKTGIHVQFCISEKHQKLLEDTLRAKLPNTIVKRANIDILATRLENIDPKHISLEAYYPRPPYFRNLFGPETAGSSPLYTLFEALKCLGDNEFFLYRLMVHPVNDKWDRNCLNLHSYENKVHDFFPDLNCGGNWFVPPAAESTRAIKEKLQPEYSALYFVHPTIAFFGDSKKFGSLKSFMHSFRFGDQYYQSNNRDKFETIIGMQKTMDFLKNRTSHMNGHLLNRYETAFLMAFPCENCCANKSFPLLRSSARPITEEFLKKGIALGLNNSLGAENCLHLPKKYLEHSFSIIGLPGFGKTNLLLNMLADIANSQQPTYSMVIFYFQNFSFVSDFISCLPLHRLPDVILAQASLNGKILGRNLVDGRGVKDSAKKASILAYALENSSANFGVDVKYVIKSLCNLLISSENTAFDHALNILLRDDPVGHAKRNEVKRKTRNQSLIKFIEHIEAEDENLKKIQNKLQDFFDESNIAEMCAYTGPNLFSYQDIVENNKILIWYLGGAGTAGNAIASLEISQLHHHFSNYETVFPAPVHPTIVAIDEAQRIKAKGVADSIREDRKHGLSYIISTQSLQGLDSPLREGIDLIANSAFFQCAETDAKYFAQKCSGIVTPKEIVALDKYELIVRILSSQNVFQCNTSKFNPRQNNNLDFVVRNCQDKYYLDPVEQRNIRIAQEIALLNGGRPKTAVQKLRNLPASIMNKIGRPTDKEAL